MSSTIHPPRRERSAASRTTCNLILTSLCYFSLLAPALAQVPDRVKLSQMNDDPKEPLAIVSSYLTMVEQMQKSISDPLSVLIIAQHDMKEIYRKTGTPDDAVKEFRRILDGLQHPAARTAVRFAIVDIWKVAGDDEKALAELKLIVDENKARLAQRD